MPSKTSENWIATPASKSLSGRLSRDTAPEMLLRRALHREGLRYRVHTRIGERLTLDIDFTRARVAVFVDGHFWHDCERHPRPRPGGPNAAAWRVKFEKVDERERRAERLLAKRGYRVLRFPECAIREAVQTVVSEISAAVRRR
jgi:DNA mismatch endonuclease, patch repair protein